MVLVFFGRVKSSDVGMRSEIFAIFPVRGDFNRSACELQAKKRTFAFDDVILTTRLDGL